MSTVALTATPASVAGSRTNEIWRTVRLHLVNPSVFFGVPWVILGTAWAMSMAIGAIFAGATHEPIGNGMRYSWAALSPQWYLVVVGVQAIAYTLPFALGFGSTRRGFWLGTSVMFVLASTEMAVAIATLVQIEKATNGWGIGIHMFDALWYGGNWLTDFYTTFAMQLFVLFVGATATTVYMRWRMRGMLVLAIGAAVVLIGIGALLTWTQSWPGLFTWFTSVGIVGGFTVVLALAAVFAVGGYLVIRRATPR
jgi:hypothetical protein